MTFFAFNFEKVLVYILLKRILHFWFSFINKMLNSGLYFQNSYSSVFGLAWFRRVCFFDRWVPLSVTNFGSLMFLKRCHRKILWNKFLKNSCLWVTVIMSRIESSNFRSNWLRVLISLTQPNRHSTPGWQWAWILGATCSKYISVLVFLTFLNLRQLNSVGPDNGLKKV